ncbi:hypothetical protein AMC99_00237 [Altererythrobacter epoxidivorans]|uniref:Zinc-finger protein n=1 Tax=Altererythrobacter epoxidivorans TaxID=361183 RepID=A0A0M4M2G3_9SPHN|nr:DUF983 domain-containing protein [Altererythrobacter epoxidivorans]ALE15553.1 hypothetical protein AMC99_00237 [Altererythrobacter epoxidivorans]
MSLPTSSLPPTIWAAILRGIRGRCPRCGGGSLFRKWLKPRDACPACGLDLTPQQTDDFPAYISIFVTGHLMAPLIILLATDFELGTLGMGLIVIPLALVMMLGMLQPAKGLVVAAQWWNGMHGFRRERVEADQP